ncbi:serine--tRNA ligase [Portibacter lacus]|uniref:Serine--tRNA ligase n=1 Tax=Portibacter lacus TaxID=1099794 RepID=A0AA37WH05_9BACT|nr:serine--tRNA ligase [Portibacter lacus]GLR18794.1 serine--tRNA ligase [Portibacter lacus]
MLQVKIIEDHLDEIKESLKKRNWGDTDISVVEKIIDLNTKRKAVQTELDQEKAKLNQLSSEIGNLFKSGKKDEAVALKDEVAKIKLKSEEQDALLTQITSELENNLLSVPNKLHPSVPAGSSEEDNEIYKPHQGDLPVLSENALPHWELAEKYNLIDFKLGAFIAGSGFPLFRGKGSRLQRALISYFLDEASNAGYEEIVPPLLVNEDSARATGQLPDKEGQMYYVERDDLYLIPTAEVPITNIMRDQIIEESDFPIKFTGYTPCFRREAGSYGAHVKGLNRVHQFDKVEIVQIEHPDKSYDTLHDMVAHVEHLLNSLKLPYRILRLCGGDTGFTSALTFDFEVYSAAQKRWLEVSSVSNFETFQANRLKLRYKDGDGKKHLAHTLNGSALALARIIACILENYQTEDGIKMPEVLVKYLGFDKI